MQRRAECTGPDAAPGTNFSPFGYGAGLMKLATALLLASLRVFAQEMTPPPVMAAEDAEVAQVPTGFLDQALKVDVKNRITEGKAGTLVTHRQLYERTGRIDLVTQSDNRAARRLWLAISAGVVAGAAGIVGGVLIATAPRLNTVECESDVRVYNDVCVPRAAQHNVAGTAVIATGVVTGLLLGTLAFWSDPDVLTRDQTLALVSGYNSQLAKRLRAKPQGLKLLPMVTPDGAMLSAALRF